MTESQSDCIAAAARASTEPETGDQTRTAASAGGLRSAVAIAIGGAPSEHSKPPTILSCLDCHDFPRMDRFPANGSVEGAGIVILQQKFADAWPIRKPPMFIDDYGGHGFARSVAAARPISFTDDFCYALPDARMIGFRSVVTPDAGYLCDERLVDRPVRKAFFQRLTDPRKGNREETDLRLIDGQLTSCRIDAPGVSIAEPVVSIGSDEPSNFGSWLFRFLPKLITARACGLGALKIFANLDFPWQRELLGVAGVGPEQVIPHNVRNVYKFDQLFVPSVRNAQLYFDGETQAFYDQILDRHGIQRVKRDRIYVSRRRHAAKRPNHRVFLNEAEFANALAERGFRIIEPETLPFVEQMATFAAAAMVVGPSGSGMFNCIFCPRGTTIVDIESAAARPYQPVCQPGSRLRAHLG